MHPRFHSLTVADVRRETDDTVSIAFDVPANLAEDYAFRQGQYLTLRTTLDGQEVRRSYSICSGLDEGELRVAVKRVDGGLFSTYANENLKPGAQLDVMTPTGPLHQRDRPRGQPHLRAVRRRQRDHAGHLDRQDPAGARSRTRGCCCSTATAASPRSFSASSSRT